MTKDHMIQNQFLDFVKYRKYKIHFLLYHTYLGEGWGDHNKKKTLPQLRYTSVHTDRFCDRLWE